MKAYKIATLLVTFGLLLAVKPTISNAQSGHVLNGVGPVDQAMAGAGMAAPREALGSVHWNPASISALEESSLDLSI